MQQINLLLITKIEWRKSFTAKEKGEPVIVQYTESDSREVNWIYEQIISLRLNVKDFSFRDVAILMRANYLTLPFERHFYIRMFRTVFMVACVSIKDARLKMF